MAFEIENEDVYFCEKVKAKVQDEFKKAEEFGDSGNIVNQLLHLSAAVNCVDLALLTTKLSSEDSSDFLKKRNDMKPLIDELKTRLLCLYLFVYKTQQLCMQDIYNVNKYYLQY